MKLDSATILVTGGAGFIGSHLVDALTGLDVRVLDDFSTGSYANLTHHGDSLQIVNGDIRDPDLVDEVVKDVDVIFHLACRGVRHSIGNPLVSHEVNASGTLNLLQAARRHGVQKFVHVSSSEVYGTARRVPMDEDHACFPETVYGAAKLAGECYARAYYRTYRFPTVVVRPFNNFGPRSHFEGDSGEVIPRFCAWAINQMPPVIFGDGTQTRDFIYVEDTAQWLRRIAESDEVVGLTLNLGSGKEVSVNELAEIVYQLANCPELKPRHLQDRPGDVKRLLSDSRLATKLIGFKPSTNLDLGIAKLIEYLKITTPQSEDLLQSIEDCNWKLMDATAKAI